MFAIVICLVLLMCKSGPHCCGREGSTQFVQHLVSAVTDPPLVGCVVWSLFT